MLLIASLVPLRSTVSPKTRAETVVATKRKESMAKETAPIRKPYERPAILSVTQLKKIVAGIESVPTHEVP